MLSLCNESSMRAFTPFLAEKGLTCVRCGHSLLWRVSLTVRTVGYLSFGPTEE